MKQLYKLEITGAVYVLAESIEAAEEAAETFDVDDLSEVEADAALIASAAKLPRYQAANPVYDLVKDEWSEDNAEMCLTKHIERERSSSRTLAEIEAAGQLRLINEEAQ